MIMLFQKIFIVLINVILLVNCKLMVKLNLLNFFNSFKLPMCLKSYMLIIIILVVWYIVISSRCTM